MNCKSVAPGRRLFLIFAENSVFEALGFRAVISGSPRWGSTLGFETTQSVVPTLPSHSLSVSFIRRRRKAACDDLIVYSGGGRSLIGEPELAQHVNRGDTLL